MSTAWKAGSTRAWRQLRAYVLARDRWTCQVPVEIAGLPDFGPVRICGKFAKTAGHIVAKVDGGQDTMANVRAECEAHNYGDGGRLAHAVRALVRRWAW